MDTNFGERFIQYRETGDLRAFEEVVDYFNRPIFNYLYRLLRNEQEAQDALQEVWLRVIKQRHGYQEQGYFSSWLYRIAHNYCLDLFRKKNKLPHTDDVLDIHNQAAPESLSLKSEASPFQALEEKEWQERLEEAVETLPVLIREVYLLRTVHEIPFKEIANIQECPIGTVLSRMNQALKKLQNLLLKDYESAAAGSA